MGYDMNNIKIQLPLDEKTALSLKTGDTVLLTGEIYTGRDAAHKRLMNAYRRASRFPLT
jgi:fumarate hydratase subunit beta